MVEAEAVFGVLAGIDILDQPIPGVENIERVLAVAYGEVSQRDAEVLARGAIVWPDCVDHVLNDQVLYAPVAGRIAETDGAPGARRGAAARPVPHIHQGQTAP